VTLPIVASVEQKHADAWFSTLRKERMNWVGCRTSYSPAGNVVSLTVNENGTRNRSTRGPVLLWAWAAVVIRQIAMIVIAKDKFRLLFIFNYLFA
jgi:hypothetical protein